MHLQLRDQKLKAILCVYILTPISKPHGYHKPKIYNRCNLNKTLKIVNKPQEKRKKGKKKPRVKGQRKSTKTNPKQLTKGNKNTYISNYLKCKWTKCSKQKTDWLNGYKNKTHIYAV